MVAVFHFFYWLSKVYTSSKVYRLTIGKADIIKADFTLKCNSVLPLSTLPEIHFHTIPFIRQPNISNSFDEANTTKLHKYAWCMSVVQLNGPNVAIMQAIMQGIRMAAVCHWLSIIDHMDNTSRSASPPSTLYHVVLYCRLAL